LSTCFIVYNANTPQLDLEDKLNDPRSLADHNGHPDILPDPDPIPPALGADPELEVDPDDATLADVKIALEFINLVRNATLEGSDLDPDMIDQLKNPKLDPPDISDPDLLFALQVFIATTNASEEVYTNVIDAFLERCPDTQPLSHNQIKRRISHITGISPLVHDMCINSCMGYTGPFAE